jgi:hypothetical protein
MPYVDWNNVVKFAIAALAVVCITVGVMATVAFRPTPPAMTIYPECDMQVALIKELQRKVQALEDLNPAKLQISDPPAFPPAVLPKPARKPERSILIDPNSRIIGGEKQSRAYWGCPCLGLVWNRGNAAEQPEHAND